MVAPGRTFYQNSVAQVQNIKWSIRTRTCIKSVTRRENIELKRFRIMVAPGIKYTVRTVSLKTGIFNGRLLKRFRFMVASGPKFTVRTASLKPGIFKFLNRLHICITRVTSEENIELKRFGCIVAPG